MCIQCEDLWSLMRDFASGSETIAVLPPRVQRSLMTSLVMSAMGNKKKTFLSQVSMCVCDQKLLPTAGHTHQHDGVITGGREMCGSI